MPPRKRRRGTQRKSTVRGLNRHTENGSSKRRPVNRPPKKARRSRPAKAARSRVKLQRWMDLLAALLARHYPATLEDLTADVPGYGDTDTYAPVRRRMFERDKAELRRLGVPLETVTLDDGETVAYRLSTHDFYLPYLWEAHAGRTISQPKRIDRYGYRGLTPLVFEPEELRFVSMAAERLRALNAASLSTAAESGLRKLHFDLPFGVLHPELEHVDHIIGPRASTKAEVLDALIEAVTGREARSDRLLLNRR